jgi:hypothetical protein
MFAFIDVLLLLFPGPSTLPRTHKLTGIVTIEHTSVAPQPIGSACRGWGKLAEIHEGAVVIVLDHDQAMPARTELDAHDWRIDLVLGG